MGTRGWFPGGKTAGAWSWPLTSIYCQDQECVELYLHSPNTPSWRGTQLKKKHRDKFYFTRRRKRKWQNTTNLFQFSMLLWMKPKTFHLKERSALLGSKFTKCLLMLLTLLPSCALAFVCVSLSWWSSSRVTSEARFKTRLAWRTLGRQTDRGPTVAATLWPGEKFLLPFLLKETLRKLFSSFVLPFSVLSFLTVSRIVSFLQLMRYNFTASLILLILQ
jgi:hypothetical protein